MRKNRLMILTAAAIVLVAQASAAMDKKVKGQVAAIQATSEIPEDLLLDVGVQVFDPGIPPGDEMKLRKKGVFPEIRKSESRFIAVHLKRTLESTGHWGAVRVLPQATAGVDLTIQGQITKSNGKDLTLEIRVVDALGRVWLQRQYAGEADAMVYWKVQRKAEGKQVANVDLIEPYQSLYNTIANDVRAAEGKLKPEWLRDVRRAARLRFAAEMAPGIFGDYVVADSRGRFSIEKLPATTDPMIERIDRIRERDQMFIDTLNEYYATFYSKMDEHYDDWRMYSYTEQVALEELQGQSRWRKILGVGLILGGIITSGNSRSSDVVRQGAVIGGAAVLKSGIEKGKDQELHKAALEELAASFDAEIDPLVVDVDGEVLRLSGSAETQFGMWRALLRDIFAHEMGLPVDPNADATSIDAQASEG